MIREGAAVAVAVMTLGACTSSFGNSGGSGAQEVGKYTQTWQRSYRTLRCSQWLDEMTAHQRFVASHDFIVALKAYRQTDGFAEIYARDISKDCRPDPSMKVSQVAAAFATLDTSDFPR